MSLVTLCTTLFEKKRLQEVHLLRNSQKNVRTIISLLFWYNIAIIRIKVKL